MKGKTFPSDTNFIIQRCLDFINLLSRSPNKIKHTPKQEDHPTAESHGFPPVRAHWQRIDQGKSRGKAISPVPGIKLWQCKASMSCLSVIVMLTKSPIVFTI